MTMQLDPLAGLAEQVVDTDRYPLHDPGSPRWREVVARVGEQLATVGCSVLEDFVRPDLRPLLQQQGDAVAPRAYYDVETVNVYNTDPDPTLPADHPARVTMERGNAFVARDEIPAGFVVHRLYTDPVFQQLLADCFGLSEIHPLTDPLSGLTVNVVAPGRSHPWHFDLNELTVSMVTRQAEAGGVFEYCPGIRSADAEHLDDVREVLRGGDRLVRRLALRPGDLQLFAGRYSLHRVTAVQGAQARHSAIFAYSRRPGVIGSVARTRQLFGRVTAAHLPADGRSVRVDRLLD